MGHTEAPWARKLFSDCSRFPSDLAFRCPVLGARASQRWSRVVVPGPRQTCVATCGGVPWPSPPWRWQPSGQPLPRSATHWVAGTTGTRWASLWRCTRTRCVVDAHEVVVQPWSPLTRRRPRSLYRRGHSITPGARHRARSMRATGLALVFVLRRPCVSHVAPPPSRAVRRTSTTTCPSARPKAAPSGREKTWERRVACVWRRALLPCSRFAPPIPPFVLAGAGR
jgi:hypothetical protein